MKINLDLAANSLGVSDVGTSREDFDRLTTALFANAELLWPTPEEQPPEKKLPKVNKGKPPKAGSLDEAILKLWTGGTKDRDVVARKLGKRASLISMRLAFMKKRDLLA